MDVLAEKKTLFLTEDIFSQKRFAKHVSFSCTDGAICASIFCADRIKYRRSQEEYEFNQKIYQLE
jgi:hypothetical protein